MAHPLGQPRKRPADSTLYPTTILNGHKLLSGGIAQPVLLAEPYVFHHRTALRLQLPDRWHSIRTLRRRNAQPDTIAIYILLWSQQRYHRRADRIEPKYGFHAEY